MHPCTHSLLICALRPSQTRDLVQHWGQRAEQSLTSESVDASAAIGVATCRQSEGTLLSRGVCACVTGSCVACQGEMSFEAIFLVGMREKLFAIELTCLQGSGGVLWLVAVEEVCIRL